jgi:YbbR domain-containing protein
VASFFRRLADNWKLKVLAFALAVLLWVVVSADQVTSTWIGVPLEVQVTDPGYQVLTNDVPREVQVRFAGPGRDLLDLAIRRPPLRLTIPDVDDRETWALDPRMVQIPGQVAVNALDVRPATVRLQFSRIDTRTVPVRVQVDDQLDGDWMVVDTLQAEPSGVRISGPAGSLAGIGEIPTRPVQLTGEDTVIDDVVPLDTTGLRGLTLSHHSVRVTGTLDRVVERTVPVPVDVGPGIVISPRQVTVHLRGPASVVEGPLPFSRVAVAVDELPVRVPPEGVMLPLRLDRLRAGVEATIEPSAVRLFPNAMAADTLPDDPGVLGVPVIPDSR